MNDLQLDWNLNRASTAAGEVDFAEDVGCCIRVSRSGSAGTFGISGDGRDTIDSESELLAVLGNSASRVKVVNLISYCSGPGTNIVGCAFRPGNAMAVVRTANNEGLLWLHEYGHNAGLEHNNDNRYVMYSQLSSSARALTVAECGAYHTPPPATAMTPLDIGVCHDDDADDLVSTADNCPDDYNPTQTDQDSDGQGDVCDSGCDDLDSDGYGDPGDPLCSAGSAEDCDDGDPDVNPGAREICDTIDNNCDGNFDDVTCDQLEATGDTTVDGVELAWLGWAFSLCSVPPHNEWWLPVDYTGDGCVDGDDLAILATAYNCSGIEAVCE
jgi:hypothetical protein